MEIYSRGKAWDLDLYIDENDGFSFESVGLNLSMADIYQDVEFEAIN